MPLLVNSVPNLAQGVSQQPDNLRYPGQCDEQINAWATVVEGLVKRPPTNYKKNIDATDPGANLFTHFVKRDEQNKYCVTVSLGGVGVIDLDSGNNIPVTTTSIATSYLSLGTSITNPLEDIRALTVADYTFLVNKNKTIATNTVSLGQIPDDEAIVFVKLGDYEKAYSIYVDDSLVPPNFPTTNHHHYTATGHAPSTYISGPSSGSHAGKHADTEYIAKDLKDCLDAELGGGGLVGIDAITVTNGGSGYLGFYDNVKVEITVTQPTFDPEASALGVANITPAPGNVSTGPITSVDMIRKGTRFSSDLATHPLVFTVKEYVFFGAFGVGWVDYTPVGSGATFTATTISRANVDITRKGSVIRLKSNDGPFKIRVEDGLSNEGLGLAYQEVASITDLPKSCFNNFSIKVKGDADIDQDDYFVRFSTKDKSEFGEGTWVECVGWTRDESESGELTPIEVKLDETTMPITLVPVLDSNGDVSSFKLQSPEEDQDPTPPAVSGWRGRGAGNDETNPFPSFVGSTINDVFFFKNRLGFLTDSNVVFSEADEYFNFFRTTTQQLLDSAPIDVGLSHTKVAVLQHAVPFQEKLMLFSKQSQFVLRGAEVLSPKTVAIAPVTEYDISDTTQPIALGNYIYFTFKRNEYEGVYEYFVDNNTETFNSEEITQQIPKYITSDVKRIAGSQSENTIVIGTSADAKTLFVYKYYWSNKEKIQSAWMKFTFDRDVRGFDFIDSNLHLLTADAEGLHLEQLTLEDGIKDTGLDYTLYLDSRVDGEEVTVSLYNPSSKVTRVSGIPYNVSLGNTEIYTKLGNERAFTIVDSNTVDVSGSLASYVDDGSGDYVIYSGELYYCVTAHTSTSEFQNTYWRKVTEGPDDINAWSATTAYNAGVIYKCQTNHTSPSTFVAVDTSVTPNITYWTTTSEVSTATLWTAGKFYNNDQYFFIGKSYNMLYRFSDQTLKQPTERGGRSASDYAFQTIRNGSINYADTGHFTVEVTPKYRDKYTYAFNPDSVGANLILNAFTPQNGHFRFPVQAQPEDATIEVVSDSALPVKLLAAEFESMMIPRSRRYGA